MTALVSPPVDASSGGEEVKHALKVPGLAGQFRSLQPNPRPVHLRFQSTNLSHLDSFVYRAAFLPGFFFEFFVASATRLSVCLQAAPISFLDGGVRGTFCSAHTPEESDLILSLPAVLLLIDRRLLGISAVLARRYLLDLD